jgi:hypothetical protein
MIFGQQSASWWDTEALINRLAANEEEVRRNFWRKLRQLVSQVPFAEDLWLHIIAPSTGRRRAT